AASSSLIHSTHWYGAKTVSASFEPTSESTVKSRARSAISSSLRSRGRSTTPSDTSTCCNPSSCSHDLYSSTFSCATTASRNVPPITTGLPAARRTSSFRCRFWVTYAVPQPSFTMSMYAAPTSRTSSHARGPRPLSITCVRPLCGCVSKPRIELLELLARGGLHVAVERVAVGIDPDGQRAEVLDAELPEALGHQLLPRDLLDLLDLRRLERSCTADDREVDHPETLHRLDRLVGEASLAADRPYAVPRAERLGEAHHARGRRRADADLLVLPRPHLAHVRGGVEEERAAEIHRRLDSLVEDPDLRPVADADDVALDDHLVARAELQDLLRVVNRKRDFMRGHRSGLPVVVDLAVRGDVRARATRGPALVVDRDGIERHVRVGVLDVAVEDGHVPAEAHRPDPRLVQELEELVLELGHDRIGVARPDRPHDRLLGEVHRVVGRAADADADDPRRARLAAGADDRLEHELLDPLHAVGGDAHLEEAHVLRAGALRDALDVEAVPVGDELPVDDRQPVADVRPGVLSGDRVHRVRAERVLERRPCGAVAQRLVDARRMQREALADTAVVDGDARVLAHEVLLAVGDVDVPVNRLQHPLPRYRRLARPRRVERVPEVLRDVLQRPDVQMCCRVLDRLLQLGVHVDDHSAPRLLACRPSRAASEDHTLEKAVAHHPVAPVRAACDLAARVDAVERRLSVRVDHEPAVLVVEHGVREDLLRERVDARSAVAAEHVRKRHLGVGLR